VFFWPIVEIKEEILAVALLPKRVGCYFSEILLTGSVIVDKGSWCFLYVLAYLIEVLYEVCLTSFY
jgi:hypothetical protein